MTMTMLPDNPPDDDDDENNRRSQRLTVMINVSANRSATPVQVELIAFSRRGRVLVTKSRLFWLLWPITLQYVLLFTIHDQRNAPYTSKNLQQIGMIMQMYQTKLYTYMKVVIVSTY